MQQATIIETEPEFLMAKVKPAALPWFFIPPDNAHRIYYRYNWFSEFFAQENMHHQAGLGLSFIYRKYIGPGTKLEISIPLPDTNSCYEADVIMIREKNAGYEIGIWLPIHSSDDSELLLCSCQFTSA